MAQSYKELDEFHRNHSGNFDSLVSQNMDRTVVSIQPSRFAPSMLDLPSQGVYEELSKKHISGPKITEKVNGAGQQLIDTVHVNFVSKKENLSYSDLLCKLVSSDETILSREPQLSLSNFTIKDVTKQPVTKPGGIVVITDKRLLLISAQYYQAFSLSPLSDPKKLPGGYTVHSSCSDTTYYFPIPLHLLRSIELESQCGMAGTVSIFGKKPICCGLFTCFGCTKTWNPSPLAYSEVNQTIIKIGLLLPPWQDRATLELNINPNTSLAQVRDIMALLQSTATNLM